ncbi:MAG: hypothetical protein OHK0057_34740 [Thermoflexibacter sp.]
MGISSSGFSQIGSITIVGNQNVCGASTWTYSITGTSCSTANWIVGGGTVLSSNNISVTVQWNNSGTTGYISVNAYSCSPTPAERSGFLSVNVIKPPCDIKAEKLTGTNRWKFTADCAVSNCFQWQFSGINGLNIESQSGNSIIITFTSFNVNRSVCVNTCPIDCQAPLRQPFCAYNIPF